MAWLTWPLFPGTTKCMSWKRRCWHSRMLCAATDTRFPNASSGGRPLPSTLTPCQVTSFTLAAIHVAHPLAITFSAFICRSTIYACHPSAAHRFEFHLRRVGLCRGVWTNAGDFDPNKKVVDQKCALPGSNLGVRLEMGMDGHLRPAANSGPATNLSELQKMLSGGNRNSRTQPVDTLPILLFIHPFIVVQSLSSAWP